MQFTTTKKYKKIRENLQSREKLPAIILDVQLCVCTARICVLRCEEKEKHAIKKFNRKKSSHNNWKKRRSERERDWKMTID